MKLLSIIMPASLLGVILFLSTFKDELSLFPHNETQFEFIPITNSDEYISATTAQMDVDHGHLHFRYTLDSSSANPYALLLLHAHELQREVNLSSYDELVITVDPLDCSDFTVTLYVFEKGISDYDNMETHRPLSIKCRTEKGKSVYHLPLKDFATPHSWFSFMDITPENLAEPSLEAMTHLTFTHFDEKQCGVEQAITISELKFVDNSQDDLVLAIAGGLLLFVILIPLYLKMKKSKHLLTKRKVYYAGNEGGDKANSEILLHFFHDEFSNPLFSLQMIERKLGYKPVAVNEILSKEINSSYKQYLNTLRIDKAKYLLTESEMPIATIASEVGYCYANSFSRAFRNVVGVTPQSFRHEQLLKRKKRKIVSV